MHFFCKCLKISWVYFCDFWAFLGKLRRIGQKRVCRKEKIITHVYNYKERARTHKERLRMGFQLCQLFRS